MMGLRTGSLLLGVVLLFGAIACGSEDSAGEDNRTSIPVSPEDAAYDQENLALLEELAPFPGAVLEQRQPARAPYADGRWAVDIYAVAAVTVDDVIQFYSEQLLANGWEPLEEEGEGEGEGEEEGQLEEAIPYRKGAARLALNLLSLEPDGRFGVVVDARFYAEGRTPPFD